MTPDQFAFYYAFLLVPVGGFLVHIILVAGCRLGWRWRNPPGRLVDTMGEFAVFCLIFILLSMIFSFATLTPDA